ncbi:MAG: hypothetical protein A2W36_03085 [Chloroflexi bacterium RBG_16_58_14]|nr:MAG: hypothetical protein A2W36_03085 [Chloroflexi bacterium RBG_16_58_14]
MNKSLILATAQGIVLCEKTGSDWRFIRREMQGSYITSLTAQDGVILAGTRLGVFRSTDQGNSWNNASAGLEHPHIRWLASDPQSTGVHLAGSEPAGIFLSQDGEETWHGRPEVTQLRQQHRWSLPYSPEAGCVRGFAFHGKRVYAAVEVGGVLVSEDGGKSWQLVEDSPGSTQRNNASRVDADVHSIAVHPTSPDLVYAPTGGGFYRSMDGGKNWRLRYRCYCRAVWVNPTDPDHLILGPADYVDRNGRIEESLDGGQSWRPASPELSVPWPRHMVERFFQAGDELLAVLSNGDLLVTPLAALAWRRIISEAQGVTAVANLMP